MTEAIVWQVWRLVARGSRKGEANAAGRSERMARDDSILNLAALNQVGVDACALAFVEVLHTPYNLPRYYLVPFKSPRFHDP